MRKHTLEGHPEVTHIFYVDAIFFDAGTKFGEPDQKEKIKEFNRQDGKIIVIGEKHTKCSITAENIILDEMQLILNNYIGVPIENIKNIKIN